MDIDLLIIYYSFIILTLIEIITITNTLIILSIILKENNIGHDCVKWLVYKHALVKYVL